jgi:hypothetical protein
MIVKEISKDSYKQTFLPELSIEVSSSLHNRLYYGGNGLGLLSSRQEDSK